MRKELKKVYKVLMPIGVEGERYEKGAEVKLTSEEAKRIGTDYVVIAGKDDEPTDEVETDEKPVKKAKK